MPDIDPKPSVPGVIPDTPPHVRCQPWANLCKIVPNAQGFTLRWCGKKQELSATSSFWLHPGSNTWVEQVPNVYYPSHGAAYDAAMVSPEPPGWK